MRVREKDPAGPSNLAAYQTRRVSASFGRAARRGPTPDDGLDFAPGTLHRAASRPVDSGKANPIVGRKVLAGRTPTLLFRFTGAFLLR
jgi:hypothetical protein